MPDLDIIVEPETDDVYQPESGTLHDNGMIIFDMAEFAEVFDCYAAQMFDGQLFVLKRSDKIWQSVGNKTGIHSVK